MSLATWVNEQAMREVYLVPFEMCVKAGNVEVSYVKDNGDGTYENATAEVPAGTAVMTAFNRLGATWTGGNYALITELLRDEWGFDGWIVTDSASSAGEWMDATQMIEAGGVSKLAMADSMAHWTFDENDPTQYYYAREALHNLLYTTANSNAMQGIMHGSAYRPGIQKIEKLMIGINVVSVVGLGLISFTAWRNHVKRKAERAEA